MSGLLASPLDLSAFAPAVRGRLLDPVTEFHVQTVTTAIDNAFIIPFTATPGQLDLANKFLSPHIVQNPSGKSAYGVGTDNPERVPLFSASRSFADNFKLRKDCLVHPEHAVARIIATFGDFCLRSRVSELDPKVVCEIGVAPATVGKSKFHCCSDVSSSRDPSRIHSAIVTRPNEQMLREAAGDLSTNRWCLNGIQKCDKQHLVGIASDSIYDISPEMLTRAMWKKNMNVVYATLWCPPQLNDDGDGDFENELYHLQMKGKKVRMDWRDGSFAYEHDKQIWRDWAFGCGHYSKKANSSIIWETVQSWGPFKMVKIVRTYGEIEVHRALPVKDGMVGIPNFAYIVHDIVNTKLAHWMFAPKATREQIRARIIAQAIARAPKIWVHKTVYAKMMMYICNRKDPDNDRGVIGSYFAARISRVEVEGYIFQSGIDVSGQEFRDLVMSFMIIGSAYRMMQTQLISKTLNMFKSGPEEDTIFGTIWHMAFGHDANPFGNWAGLDKATMCISGDRTTIHMVANCVDEGNPRDYVSFKHVTDPYSKCLGKLSGAGGLGERQGCGCTFDSKNWIESPSTHCKHGVVYAGNHTEFVNTTPIDLPNVYVTCSNLEKSLSAINLLEEFGGNHKCFNGCGAPGNDGSLGFHVSNFMGSYTNRAQPPGRWYLNGNVNCLKCMEKMSADCELIYLDYGSKCENDYFDPRKLGRNFVDKHRILVKVQKGLVMLQKGTFPKQFVGWYIAPAKRNGTEVCITNFKGASDWQQIVAELPTKEFGTDTTRDKIDAPTARPVPETKEMQIQAKWEEDHPVYKNGVQGQDSSTQVKPEKEKPKSCDMSTGVMEIEGRLAHVNKSVFVEDNVGSVEEPSTDVYVCDDCSSVPDEPNKKSGALQVTYEPAEVFFSEDEDASGENYTVEEPEEQSDDIAEEINHSLKILGVEVLSNGNLVRNGEVLGNIMVDDGEEVEFNSWEEFKRLVICPEEEGYAEVDVVEESETISETVAQFETNREMRIYRNAYYHKLEGCAPIIEEIVEPSAPTVSIVEESDFINFPQPGDVEFIEPHVNYNPIQIPEQATVPEPEPNSTCDEMNSVTTEALFSEADNVDFDDSVSNVVVETESNCTSSVVSEAATVKSKSKKRRLRRHYKIGLDGVCNCDFPNTYGCKDCLPPLKRTAYNGEWGEFWYDPQSATDCFVSAALAREAARDEDKIMLHCVIGSGEKNRYKAFKDKTRYDYLSDRIIGLYAAAKKYRIIINYANKNETWAFGEDSHFPVYLRLKDNHFTRWRNPCKGCARLEIGHCTEVHKPEWDEVVIPAFNILPSEKRAIRDDLLSEKEFREFHEPILPHLRQAYADIKVKMLIGRAGSGKTHTAMKLLKEKRLVVIVPTKALAKEYDEKYGRKNMKVLVWSHFARKPEHCETVLIDEIFMQNPILLAIVSSHCKDIYGIGDPDQLEYGGKHTSKYMQHIMRTLGTAKVQLNCSRSCPLDAVIMGRKCGVVGFKTHSTQLRSIYPREMVKPEKPEYGICFTTKEEDEGNWLTANKVQGSRVKNSHVLMDAGYHHIMQFDKARGIYVAMTRHTESCVVICRNYIDYSGWQWLTDHTCDQGGRAGALGYTDFEHTRIDRNEGDDFVARKNMKRVAVTIADGEMMDDEGNYIQSEVLTRAGTKFDKVKTTEFISSLDCEAPEDFFASHALFDQYPAPATQAFAEHNDIDEVAADDELIHSYISANGSSFADVEEVIGKISKTTSELYEERRILEFEYLGRNESHKKLTLNLPEDPPKQRNMSVITAARLRGRPCDNKVYSQMLQTILGRYSKKVKLLKGRKAEIEGEKLYAGLLKVLPNGARQITLDELNNAVAAQIDSISAKSEKQTGIFSTMHEYLAKISFFLKPQIKSDLKHNSWLRGTDDGTYYNLKAGQGVSAQPKQINHIVGGWVRAAERKIMEALDPRVTLGYGRSPTAFRQKVKSMSNRNENSDEVICCDISEQDTSKGPWTNHFMRLVYRLVGVPERIIDLIECANINWTLDARNVKLKVSHKFQSGRADTLFANTMMNIGLIMASVEINDLKLALFQGDDSYIRAQRVRMIGENPNLKVERTQFGDFIGYLIGDGDIYLDIPRFCVKLLNRTFNSNQEISEYRIAVYDWLRVFQDPEQLHTGILYNAGKYGLSEAEVALLFAFMREFYMGNLIRKVNHSHTRQNLRGKGSEYFAGGMKYYRSHNPNFVIGELIENRLGLAKKKSTIADVISGWTH